jgi:hypothetical protein
VQTGLAVIGQTVAQIQGGVVFGTGTLIGMVGTWVVMGLLAIWFAVGVLRSLPATRFNQMK